MTGALAPFSYLVIQYFNNYANGSSLCKYIFRQNMRKVTDFFPELDCPFVTAFPSLLSLPTGTYNCCCKTYF